MDPEAQHVFKEKVKRLATRGIAKVMESLDLVS